MKVIEIRVENDNLYQKIISFLKSLKISFSEKEVENGIDFSKYKINSFKEIDPISYQREIRDEW